MLLTDGSTSSMLRAATNIAERTLVSLGHRVVVHDRGTPVRLVCSTCLGAWMIEASKVHYYGVDLSAWSLEEADDAEGEHPSAPIASCAVCRELARQVEAERGRDYVRNADGIEEIP